MKLNQITIPCTDYDASVAFYQQLGFVLIVDAPPRYARFETEEGTTFSLHAVGKVTPADNFMIYFEVDDVDASVRKLEAKGIEFETQPVDQSWLWREARLIDPAGNRVCIYHGGENRRYPPWRVTD